MQSIVLSTLLQVNVATKRLGLNLGRTSALHLESVQRLTNIVPRNWGAPPAEHSAQTPHTDKWFQS